MTTQFKDYYAVLGVPRTATAKEIKAAFRKQARAHHPDVNANDPTAVDRFKEINEAHEVLGDPEKRKHYDELGPQWQQYEAWERAGKPGGAPFAGGQTAGSGSGYRTVNADELEEMFGDREPFSDFFKTFFSGGGRGHTARRAPQAQRGQDVEGEAEITLEEAYHGTTRTMELSDGQTTRRVSIKIPAGVADKGRVRAGGQGSRGASGGAHGDLYIRVRLRPHATITRIGDDLQTRVAVPLSTALLGGTVSVPTLRGRPVALTVPPETQNGARLRLRGLGMPHLRGTGNGDLYAEVDVRLPVPLSDAARVAAEQLRDTTA